MRKGVSIQKTQVEQVYAEFPRKREPKKAKAKIAAILKSGEASFEVLLAAVKRFAAAGRMSRTDPWRRSLRCPS